MNDTQKLQLEQMISENKVDNQTDLIRKLKHSNIFRVEIEKMQTIKQKYENDADKINVECTTECSFLFTYYTDIFNKILKNEVDLNILNKFIDVLEQIENNIIDQHEASFQIGTLLKQMYVDPVLYKSQKTNDNDSNEQPTNVNISWKEYKEKRIKITKLIEHNKKLEKEKRQSQIIDNCDDDNVEDIKM
jgi:hypothetical protein